MARASGSSSPSAPSLGGKIMPSTGIIGSGFWSIKGISRRVVCSSTIEGSEKISPSQSGLPRVLLFDSQLEKISDPLSIANAALVACDSDDDGLLSFDLHSDGEGLRYLNASIQDNEVDHALGSKGSVLDFPPKRHAIISCLQMNGKEVFRFAVRCVPQSIECALEKAGLTGSSIDWPLIHQANQRIIVAVATCLEVPPERIMSNVANYGNTSAASIPLALDEAIRSEKVKPGHTIATAGFGAGLTWGSAIIRCG